jgi:hypothetical protein
MQVTFKIKLSIVTKLKLVKCYAEKSIQYMHDMRCKYRSQNKNIRK